MGTWRCEQCDNPEACKRQNRHCLRHALHHLPVMTGFVRYVTLRTLRPCRLVKIRNKITGFFVATSYFVIQRFKYVGSWNISYTLYQVSCFLSSQLMKKFSSIFCMTKQTKKDQQVIDNYYHPKNMLFRELIMMLHAMMQITTSDSNASWATAKCYHTIASLSSCP